MLYIIILSILIPISVYCQKVTHFGLPNIVNYPQEEYKASSQNWDIIQGNNGFIYVANTQGVLEYDGTEWRLIHNELARSLCYFDNKLYAAGEDLFGFFELDSSNNFQFHSLLNLFPEEELPLTFIWEIHAHKDYIYLESNYASYIYNGDSIKVIHSDERIFDFASVGDYGYILKNNNKIYQVNDQLNLEEYTLPFEIKGRNIVKINDNTLRIIDNIDGKIWNLNIKSNQLSEHPNNADKFLKNSFLFFSSHKYDYHAIGSNEGLIILDKSGKVLQYLTENHGLIGNRVYCTYFDQQDNLWLGTSLGIVRINIFSPFSYFNKYLGLKKQFIIDAGIINNDQHFIGTDGGIYHQTWLKYKNPLDPSNTFSKLGNYNNQYTDGISINDEIIFCSPQGGLTIIKKDLSSYQVDDETRFFVCDTINSTTLLSTSNSSFRKIERINNQWIPTKNYTCPELIELGDNVQNAFVLKDNKIYLSDYDSAFYVFELQEDTILFKRKVKFLSKEHLNTMGTVYTYKGKLQFKTTGGVYNIDETTLKVDSDIILNKTPSPITDICINNNPISKAPLFYQQEDGIFGSYSDGKHDSKSLNLLGGIKELTVFKQINDSLIIIGNKNELITYNYLQDYTQENNIIPFIRKVELINNDSIISNGYFYNTDSIITFNQQEKHHLPFSQNNLRFTFSIPFFKGDLKNQYSFKLEGFDDNWSAWSTINKKDYTNIPEGTYIFKVKALNGFKQESQVATFEFKIYPPWYRTWYAYSFYSILFLIGIYGLIKWNTRRLERRNEELEIIVTERTEEVRQQAEEIQTQNDQLVEMYDVLEERNIKITDSINYAKKIQAAMLTSQEVISEMFEEHFLLYLPRDIVSGDFYWAYKTPSGKILWTAADCTGHGVPGAMMSMIGNSFLNEIVIEKGIEEPGKILDNLRELLLKALERGGSDNVKEGMDIAFCSYDPKTMELQFAGAFNPLFIFRGGELMETPGSNMPIGEYKVMNPFENHVLQAQKGDIIYLFSDGYPDQMGGPKGKKFLLKRFRKVLTDIQDLPLEEQNNKLKEVFNNWKAEKQQMDDVVVFGVKV